MDQRERTEVVFMGFFFKITQKCNIFSPYVSTNLRLESAESDMKKVIITKVIISLFRYL